jgi:hypothetical protein
MTDDNAKIAKHKNDAVVAHGGIRYVVFLVFISPCILFLIVGIGLTMNQIQYQLKLNALNTRST